MTDKTYNLLSPCNGISARSHALGQKINRRGDTPV